MVKRNLRNRNVNRSDLGALRTEVERFRPVCARYSAFEASYLPQILLRRSLLLVGKPRHYSYEAQNSYHSMTKYRAHHIGTPKLYLNIVPILMQLPTIIGPDIYPVYSCVGF